MSNRSETFGRLLKGAINSIAAYEGKTAPAVEMELGDQIGVTGASIQRYKAGYLPPEPRPIQILAEAGVRRGFLARTWLLRFLQAARYPHADTLVRQLADALGVPVSAPIHGLPGGTVALLFTDIAGSTERWEAQPRAMERALERHDRIMRQAIDAYGGQVFKTVGDAFHAVFTTVPTALEAALSAQRALQTEVWEPIEALSVRMAIHVGAPQQRDGDYFGPPLNRVARMLSAGHGGQVLLSLSAQELVRDLLPPGVVIRDLGEQRLKDLGRPERIFQASTAELPDDFPPLRTLDAYRHNLPLQSTHLIGREREVERVHDLLSRDETRLLTLTGPGGIGKTRLALQAAAELLDDYPDGVTFVALSPVRDPAAVPTAIAQALGLREVAELPPIEQLKHALQPRQALLVLDNFEQILPAAPVIADLLGAAPKLKALVTSREVLHLYGEQEYSVPPLSLPEPGRIIPIERLAQVEAVRLFIERAQAVRPDFVVTNETAPVIAAICARLDGLPLAIELAAARSKLFPPKALLARLDKRLHMLTGGPRDLPARQQTLAGAIAWSYDLLDATEQAIFARLGVFAGGWSVEMAEAVIGDDGADDTLAAYVPTGAVLDGLSALVDRSLVRQVAEPDDEPRFVMLETIREYALERLTASGEEAAIRARHASMVADLAEQAEPLLYGPEQVVWFHRLDVELNNIYAALAWSMEGDPELGLRIVGACWWHWRRRGHVRDGLMWTERAIAAGRDGTPRARARALLAAGLLESAPTAAGNAARAAAHFKESMALWHGLSDQASEMFCSVCLAWLAIDDATTPSDLAAVEQSFHAADAFARASEDDLLLGWVLPGLAYCRNLQGDRAGAQSYTEQNLQLARKRGDITDISEGLRHMASLTRAEYPQRVAWLEESEQLARTIGDAWALSGIQDAWGEMSRANGDDAQAAVHYQAALALVREQGMRHLEPLLHCNLGRVAERSGDLAAAALCYRQALTIAQEHDDKRQMWLGLSGLAQVAARRGMAEQAARIFGATALNELKRYWLQQSADGINEQLYDQGLAAARATLGDTVFDETFAAGQALTMEQAIAEALR